MQRRSLLLLGGAALASAAAVVALGSGGPPAADPGAAPLMFRDLAARLQGAMRIEVVRNAQSLAVQRQPGDVWVLPDQSGYPVRAEKVRELLVGLTELRLVEPRTANPAMLDRLGLQDPERDGSTAALLRVLDGSGAPVVALVVGRRRVRTQGNVPESVYVRHAGESQAWLAEGRLPLDADPQLWIDRDLANLPRERVLRVAVERADAPALLLVKGEGPDGVLGLAEPAGAPPAEQTRLDAVANAFEFLTLTDVRRAGEIPGALLGRARYTLTDNLAITVTLHEEGEQVWVLLEAGGDAEAERLNARWRGWAYQLGAWKRRAFLPALEELRAEAAPATPAAPPR